jgi:DNA-binding MarR family transcriptional regulator
MLLRKAYLAFHRKTNALVREYGVTADQFVVLRVIASEPGLTQIALVERTSSDANTMAAILRRLEQRKLVFRRVHARDGRARCVYVSAAGRDLQRRAYESLKSLRAALWDCTAERNHAQTMSFLQRVNEVFSTPVSDANGRLLNRFDGK